MRQDIRDEKDIKMKTKKWVWIFVFLFVFLVIDNTLAFEDTVQRYPTGKISDLWNITIEYENGHGSVTKVIAPSGYSDSYAIKLHAWLGVTYPNCWSRVSICNLEPASTDYWSFVVRGMDQWYIDYDHSDLDVLFYNTSGGLIKRIKLENYVKHYRNNNLYEFYWTGSDLKLYIDNELKQTYTEFNEMPSYFKFEIYVPCPNQEDYVWIILDDIATFPCIGLNTRYTTAYDRIDASYTTSFMSSYPDKTYKMNLKYIPTGEIKNQTVLSHDNPAGFVSWNRSEVFGYDYGLYEAYITRDEETRATQWFYYLDADSFGYINFNKDGYAISEKGYISYTLYSPDFTTYTYRIRLTDMYGTEKEKWTLSDETGKVEFDTTNYDSGHYFAELQRVTKATGEISICSFDDMHISEMVLVEGVTYDAKNTTCLPAVNISFLQNTVYYNTTSNATNGEYNITDLSIDININVNASKANYTHNDFSFTPLRSGLYNIDLFLLPDENHININPPAIVGLVQSYPFYQNVSEATVNLWNDTIGLATNNITNSMGYFEFILDNTSMQTSDIVNETFNSSEYDTWVNLANSGIVPYTEKVTNTTDENPYQRGTDYEMDYVSGKIKVLSTGNMSNNTDYHIDYEKYEATTYSINATKFKYEQMNQPQTFTVNATEIKYVYLLMNPIYNLTVRARGADTHATIMEFNTILNDGDVVQTTIGYINFSVNYGIHKVEVSADGYYPQVSYVYVAQDTEKVIYLTPLEEAGGAGTYYPPPHLVEFKVQNVWGQPLSGINVTAVPSETSMVNWSWIRSVYGYGENISQTMSGVTDSNGAVSFVMVETIKYKMYFTNESQNISAYREIYPKDDRYVITIGEIPEEKIGWWLSTAQNDTANTGNITIHYLDYNEPVKTQWVNFSIYFLENDTLVYSHNFTTVNATNENISINLNASYAYKVKITAYHEDYGIISSTTIIVFVIPEKPKLPVAQELFKHLEPWQVTLISMFVLICFGFIFGAISAGTGGLIVAAMAAGFYYFGLLPSLSKEVASIVIPLMLIVAVINKIIEQRGVIRE